jgi:hypothetical protein
MTFRPGVPKSSDERSTGSANADGPAFRRRPTTTGTHPEITLADEKLRLMGRIDLLTVGDDDATIVDYKTGEPDPGHVDQVNLYALLWVLDRVVNPQQLPVGQLTIAYPNHDRDVGPEERADLNALEEVVRSRIAIADNLADEVPPEARPAPELCGFCPVKGLCGTYWSQMVPDPSNLAYRQWFDYEGVVGPSNGVRSKWMLAPHNRERRFLLRTPPNAPPLIEGATVRLLGIRRDEDPDTDATVAVMSSTTEVLSLIC